MNVVCNDKNKSKKKTQGSNEFMIPIIVNNNDHNH